ncbi:MAG: DUF4168 domain-containing protein [Pseudomonadota bacterium]
MKKLTSILSLSTLFAMAIGMSVATAQPGGQPPGGGQQGGQPPAAGGQGQAAAPEVSDELKNKFIDAYADIMSIQTDYAEQIQAAGNEEEAMELQQAAQGEMQEAVSDNDMTVEEYNMVIQAASADPELMEELEAAIEDS